MENSRNLPECSCCSGYYQGQVQGLTDAPDSWEGREGLTLTTEYERYFTQTPDGLNYTKYLNNNEFSLKCLK